MHVLEWLLVFWKLMIYIFVVLGYGPGFWRKHFIHPLKQNVIQAARLEQIYEYLPRSEEMYIDFSRLEEMYVDLQRSEEKVYSQS